MSTKDWMAGFKGELQREVLFTSDPHFVVDALIALGGEEGREVAKEVLLQRLMHLLRIQLVVKQVHEACREACQYLLGEPPPVTIELEHPLKWLNINLLREASP
jgi:hypothetical protein